MSGTHILLDIEGVSYDAAIDHESCLRAMEQAVAQSSCFQVHSHAAQLPGEGRSSPPGFTAVVLLDESHVSCHTYAETGSVALDVFTCGDSINSDIIADHMIEYFRSTSKAVIVTQKQIARFALPGLMPIRG